MNSRLIQFDILKGIGILCVLLGHTPIYGLPKSLIYGFHMPLFFLVSGFFYKSHNNFFVRSVRQLIIPYLFFCALYNCPYFVCGLVNTHNFIDAFASLNLDIFDENCHLYMAIWFLPCLFMVRLSYTVLDKLINSASSGVILFILGLGLYVVSCLYLNISLFVDTALSVFVFFALGRLLAVYKFSTMQIPRYFIFISFVIYVGIVYVFHPYIDFKDNRFPIYAFFLSLLALLGLFQLCILLSEKDNIVINFFARCGRESLLLLGLHRPIWIFIGAVCRFFKFGTGLTVIIEMFAALLICFFLEKYMKRYIPFLIGK